MIAIVGVNGELTRLVVDQLLALGSAPNNVALVDSNQSLLGLSSIKTLLLIPNCDDTVEGVKHFNQILETAKERGAERFILLSLSCAQPDSRALVTPFLLYTECALRNTGLNWLILRRSLFVDSFAELTKQHMQSNYLRYPSTGGHCSYISKMDVARATAAACVGDYSNEVFDLTGPAAINMTELSSALSRSGAGPVEFRQVSDEEFLRQLEADDIPADKATRLLSLFHSVDAGEFSRATDHVEKLTGTAPESAQTALKRLYSDQ